MRLALAAVLSTACVQVQADLPPVCGSVSVDFAGVAAAPTRTLSVPVEQTFELGQGMDLSPITDLKIETGTVQAGAGTDLSFVQALQIAVLPPAGSALPELALLDWTAPAGPPVTLIQMPAASPDLHPYLGAQGLSLRLRATGSPPQYDWSLLVDLCASGAVDKTWSF
ncbi:MAG TPA: hypothetical protein VLW85_24655 [Myxococcales bacterium]|nr:hypothetical protein [Myxococcales bacterium]